jgi:molybdate-binding protein/DNA-binding transcriptional regulator YhcF (GntR family)
MAESYLYEKISDTIRQEILQGKLNPGDRLPSVRQMAAEWRCTSGTVQRAYQELASQGLVTSRAGQGTKVVGRLELPEQSPLRRISLIHRAEAFLLEVLTAGYTPEEVEQSVRLALDRWRAVAREPEIPDERQLRFVGSHDLAITWLAAHFQEILPGYSMQARFTGSLGGLIALAQGEADIAGSHLWDEKSGRYNAPFVSKVMPGKQVALLTMFHRRLGLILPNGNPKGIKGLGELTREDVRFINRQPGSGTRVWLDASLKELGISQEQIRGFDDEKLTHSEVARAVAEGQADVGVGLEASAQAYGLDFLFLKEERYDLAIPDQNMDYLPVKTLRDWLKSGDAERAIGEFGGYSAQEMGQIEWVT